MHSHASFAVAASLCLLSPVAIAQEKPSEPPPAVTLFTNARIFDGKSKSLTDKRNVLVRGNIIAKISSDPIPVDRSAATTIIDAGGGTLMPGLIDAHWHSIFATTPLGLALNGDFGHLMLRAGKEAEATLMRGFTSVRDMGGPVFGLKRAIDEGTVSGPRIWPSGAFISQTGGHGDFRSTHEVPRAGNAPLSHMEQVGAAAIADGPDEVRRRAREQLMLGASQIKLMAGGGVSSLYDPIDVSQYTEAEFRAAVEAAENWGTYVAVHAYTPRAIQTAIAGGVKCIEHGQLTDEATVKLMAEKGIWWSLQPFLDDEDAIPQQGPNRAKQLEVAAGTAHAYELAKKYKVKVAFGVDSLFDPRSGGRHGKQLAKLVRWFTPAEVLKMATADNAELLALSGPRSPYQGKLGVVEEGALADLLLVDGDPIADIKLVADPAKNFVVIMKDGKIYKNESGGVP
jgi:imidazolonepropionase-like amidohydrolase